MRENQGGTLYTRVYGQAVQRNVDAVEKKPLFHFYPGSTTYSVGTPGCNLRCPWCQNWQLSRARRAPFAHGGEPAQPADLVSAAHGAGCQSIAYTYTEPTVFFEYALDTARLAHQTGLANILVTNGYTPWHISRFFPAYRMRDRLPTPLETLMQARDIASRAGLRYVYLGNVREDQDTYCHRCGQVLIRRVGQRMVENNTLASLAGGRCPACGVLVMGPVEKDVQPGSLLHEGSQVATETT